MNYKGPIIIIEDDQDDQLIFEEVFRKLKYENELIFFTDGEEALAFIRSRKVIPFLIISDINLPKLNGFELRAKLKTDEDLALKCIPYLFFSAP